MSYSLHHEETHIVRHEDGALIPPDESNRDYRAYLAWVAAGNTPHPATRPALPPRLVSGKLVRYALNALDLRTSWEQQVVLAGQNTLDWWTWSAGNLVPEDNPKLERLCASVGITAKDLHDKALALAS